MRDSIISGVFEVYWDSYADTLVRMRCDNDIILKNIPDSEYLLIFGLSSAISVRLKLMSLAVSNLMSPVILLELSWGCPVSVFVYGFAASKCSSVVGVPFTRLM